MPDKITEIVSEILEKEQDVLTLFLFGSIATGTNKTESDYDFYVILDKNTKDSIREDELSKLVFESTKEFKIEVHLTFQYLFILDEDKSLILKISNEGKLIFSKTYLIAPYKQFGLQKYFICKWGIDTRRFLSGNKESGIRTNKLLISRILYGYAQKYSYQGELKESKKEGLIDNKVMFGEKETILILDSMFNHIKCLIENKNGTLQILNTCYMPISDIKGIETYHGKKDLESFLKKDKKLSKEPFVNSVSLLGSDTLWIRYDLKTEHCNTGINIKNLPEELQNNAIAHGKHKFT